MKASAWMSRYPRYRNAPQYDQSSQYDQYRQFDESNKYNQYSQNRQYNQYSMRTAHGVGYWAALVVWAALHPNAWLREFHDRLETDPAYRRHIKVAFGSSALLSTFMFVVIVIIFANAAIRLTKGSGLGPHGAFGSSGYGAPKFPTETVPPWTAGTVPYGGVVPSSRTPYPRPTTPPTRTPRATAVATPAATNTASVPTTCAGAQTGATWALAPCPQVAGQAGTLTISAAKHAGAALTISITFGTCSACTVAYPAGQYSLDASGNARVSYTVPAGAASGNTPITGTVTIAGGPTIDINAAPVQ
jgi:hypothetical protein